MNLQTRSEQYPYLSKLFLKMQYACGVQFDPVSNHGVKEFPFWRQLYKPSAPLRVLLSALKSSFAIHQLFAGGMSQHLLCSASTPPPPPRLLLLERLAAEDPAFWEQPIAGCAICSRKGYTQSLAVAVCTHGALFFSLTYFLHLTRVNPPHYLPPTWIKSPSASYPWLLHLLKPSLGISARASV